MKLGEIEAKAMARKAKDTQALLGRPEATAAEGFILGVYTAGAVVAKAEIAGALVEAEDTPQK